MARYVLSEQTARKLKRLLAGNMAASTAANRQSVTDTEDFAAPFALKWSQQQNGDEGAWIIWLPADCHLYLDGVATNVDVAAELDPAEGDDYPDGWFKIPDDNLKKDEDDTLYLNIKGTEIELNDEPDGTAIVIAKTFVDTDEGSFTVNQAIRSAIYIGGADNGCFKVSAISGTTIHFSNCLYAIGGRIYHLGPGTGETPFTATFAADENKKVVYLEINANGSTQSATIAGAASIAGLISASADTSKYVVPLYEFKVNEGEEGEEDTLSLVRDLRNMPSAAMYEFTQSET